MKELFHSTDTSCHLNSVYVNLSLHTMDAPLKWCLLYNILDSVTTKYHTKTLSPLHAVMAKRCPRCPKVAEIIANLALAVSPGYQAKALSYIPTRGISHACVSGSSNLRAALPECREISRTEPPHFAFLPRCVNGSVSQMSRELGRVTSTLEPKWCCERGRREKY